MLPADSDFQCRPRFAPALGGHLHQLSDAFLVKCSEGILLQDLPWMPLFFGKNHLVVKPYVKGYQPAPMVIEQLRGITLQK